MRRATAATLALAAVCSTLTFLALQASAASAAKVDSESAIARVYSATLEAQVNPESKDTLCKAQYVEEERFLSTGWTEAASAPCSPEDLGSGSTDQTATVQLTGLRIATTYHYRLVTTSEGNAVPGPEGTFATFGIERFSFEALGESSQLFTQAGGHPFEVTTYIAANATQYKGKVSPDAILKDALTQLPAGLVGDPMAMPRCAVRVVEEQRCSAASEVGVVTAYHGESEFGPRPLFDTVAPQGSAARFSGEVNGSTDAFIDARVRTGGDYGVTAGSRQLPEFANATAFRVTLWGVPNAASHDAERWCLEPSGSGYKEGCEAEGEPKPFLSMPTACLGPQSVTAELDSYQAPGVYVRKTVSMPPIIGCSQVPFAPSISSQPTTGVADSPSGLRFDLHVPQNESPEGVSSADLRDAVVTLPKGMSINPASAAGLAGCSTAQFGLTSAVGVVPILTTPGPAECPEAAKVGTVEVDTPLLEQKLPGAVYLATPYENPFGSLLAIYIAVSDPISGVVVKLAGKVETGPEGQLTTTFEENPQLPFEDFKLHFFEHARAPLITPATCGAFTTTSTMTPWSAPESGPPAAPTDRFDVVSAAGGGVCPSTASAEINAPSLEAGSQSTKAGAYTPFTVRVSRNDGSQRISRLSISPPPGLVGRVAGIPYCPEADIAAAAAKSGAEEAARPSCPASTELGTVTASAGAGPDPLRVVGHAYFAGPYKGAPFSMAIVTPALAGPFDLGSVVVRAGIYIDPRTAQVTVRSDEIPSQLQGIPLDIRAIEVNLSRPDFTVNPTNCNVMAITGQAVSTLGQAASLTDRFQVGGCEHLPFKPAFKVTSRARHTRRFGAYLRVNVASGPGQANIRRVFVQLPKILSARDSTLGHACSESQFAADPAGCPPGSFVGSAIAHTPLLPVPLTGPAIFVSHGGAAFPDLDVVLQGDNVTTVLVGNTLIVNQQTRSDFKSLPDVAISSFQLTLPTGPNSALAATANLCSKRVSRRVRRRVHGHVVHRRQATAKRRTLRLPTLITAQDGATIHRNTIIRVEGCKKK